MVAVIVDHQGAASLRQLDFAVALEAPPHAAETGQAALNGFYIRAALQRHADGSQRVEHIVPPRRVQPHFKRRNRAFVQVHGKAHLRAFAPHIIGINIGGLV